jgi:hypothetical protein
VSGAAFTTLPDDARAVEASRYGGSSLGIFSFSVMARVFGNESARALLTDRSGAIAFGHAVNGTKLAQ